MPADKIRSAFRKQAALCRAVGSPFTSDLLDAAATSLDETTQTGRAILGWSDDPLISALPLRLTGGLHALARSAQDKELSATYRSLSGNLQPLLTRVVAQWDDWLLPWLDSAPQTNEVGRSGVLWPGVMEVAQRYGPRVELLELGASAGLNLNMDRFHYTLCTVTSGDPAAAVHLAPAWTGPPPPLTNISVASRQGVDLNPLDVSDPVIAERLLAYVWPDQPERLARISAAVDIARWHPPYVERGDGADWIEARLAEPQEKGVTRLIYHSIALQYFPEDARSRVIRAIQTAGAKATPTRPLAWLSMEFTAEVQAMAQLRLQSWPGSGELETLAQVHPHGAAIDWAMRAIPLAHAP